MIWDRVRGAAIRVRAALTWAWPFLLAVAVVANLVVLPVLVVQMANAIDEAKRTAATTQLLVERSSPCLPSDPPDSEACVALAERDRLVAEALAGVQVQHEHQAVLVQDALDRIAELQARPPAEAPVVVVEPRTTVQGTNTPPSTTVTATTLPGNSDKRKAKK